MKKIKSKRGGKRANSGRKPVKDKKKLLPLYIHESVIKKTGGDKKAKELATDYLINISENYRAV